MQRSKESLQTIVYTKPGCIQCVSTFKELDKAGVEYTKKDVSEDEDAMQRVENLGYKSLPVVERGNVNWSGFRPDLIKEHLND